jgi:beta-glucosidase
MVKHFPGGGPQKDGEDPHFPYGREQVYPGDNFDYHLKPFLAAIAAGATQMMPYYGMPIGLEYEEVAFGFNKGILTGLLREQLGYTGIICSDWGILTDGSVNDFPNPARAWGVEHLSEAERVHKAIDAGVDQFGGESCPELVIELVESGVLSEARVDESVRLLLIEKFRLGLFDHRYVDVDAADDIVGRSDFVAAGVAAQQASIVVLKDNVLPLARQTKIWLEGVEATTAAEYGEVVTTLADADVAIVRLEAPFEPRFGGLQAFFHAGSLEYPTDERERLVSIAETVPTVFVIHLDRAVIVPELDAAAAGLIADFGASDTAVLDILFGAVPSRGRLPFDLPSSTQAVLDSASDLPFDTKDPLYRFGDGK